MTKSSRLNSTITRSLARLAALGLFAGLGFSSVTSDAGAASRPLRLPSAKTKKPKKKRLRLPGSKKKKTKKKKGLRLPGAKKKSAPVQSVSPPAPTCTIKTSELLDQRIDIKAQVSLMRKLAGSRAQRREASSMFLAIKDGTLDGMLLNWRKAVADRGASMTPQKGWWQLIPSGQTSTCLQEPAGADPMIIFRKNMTQPQVDAALSSAWKQCGLPLVKEPCAYDVDLTKPKDDPIECTTDKDCTDKGIGDFCNTSRNTCGINVGGHTVTGKTGKRAKCYDQAKKTWLKSVKTCQNDEFPRLAECTLENATNPLGLAKCLHDSYKEKESCKRDAFGAYEYKRKTVCPGKPE